MKLNRSFFSLYFLVISTFIVFSWLLDEVWSSYLEQDIESYTGYKTMLAAVGDYVKKHPEDEWKEIVAGAAKRYDLALYLMPTSDFEEAKHEAHNHLWKDNTHVYYNNDMVTIHHILDDSGQVLTLGPAKMPTRPRIEALFRVGILATFGVIIFIWLWPVSKDLDNLKKATSEFGQGNFKATAPKARSSMMESMVSSFNMMACRIKRLIDAHKELTSAVSHELRTPLARSKFALQMLERAKDDEKRAKYINQISGDITELEELINEMLIYASFDSDRPEIKFEKTDMSDLIQQQINNHNQFVGKISFINHAPELISECDKHFIDRALNNFVSNAIKYGGGEVRITLKQEKSDCIICIEDNGEGVSDDFKEVIFDAFSRGDQSRNRETGGFGLGLAIVARIMEWHQGSASIADSELGGAAFTLRWPLQG
jgi:two-component system OmpR family sensor kinase/two-component system sensor histidine kinase RstB